MSIGAGAGCASRTVGAGAGSSRIAADAVAAVCVVGNSRMSIISLRAGGVSRDSGKGAIGLRGFSADAGAVLAFSVVADSAADRLEACLGGLATERANSIVPGVPWMV